ncbi:MAG: GNAT family N-acetyltransferase [Clostridia bacterium]|nr:GNAT family N-acetyltransferase [Clostridia bacterium]
MKVIFRSARIDFVEICEDLIPDYLVMVNDKEHVDRFFGGSDRIYTAEDEHKWLASKLAEQAPVYSMIERESGRYIGNIELRDMHDKEAELGIALTYAMQDKGFGTEAVTALNAYGFGSLGLDRIYLRASPTNHRAIHVYLKCGYREVRRTEDHVYMERNKND